MEDTLWSEIADAPGEIFDIDIDEEELEQTFESKLNSNFDFWWKLSLLLLVSLRISGIWSTTSSAMLWMMMTTIQKMSTQSATKSTHSTKMPDTYNFTGDVVTVLGLVGVISTGIILVLCFTRYFNSPLRKWSSKSPKLSLILRWRMMSILQLIINKHSDMTQSVKSGMLMMEMI